ncbi:MAG: HAD hydrolase-like protein [Candidatus Moranbacteria bacterium]|nr:HAD hydrolase-like protein [Candidatus Moranbacteria bacterium]
MKIFLDFDDTLFNTAAFIGVSRSLFVDFGVSEEMYKDAWQKVREWRGLESLSYDFEAHMKELHKKKDFDDKESRKKVEDFYRERTREYVFPDVEGFLQKMRDRGNALYLISFKTGDFQDKKIAASGLAKYFDALATGPEEKGEVLRQFFGENEEVNGCFVDDRLHQIESVKRTFPKIITIHMQRREGRYHDESNESCDYVVSDLEEAENILMER